MSLPRVPRPARRRYSGGQIAMILIGTVLLVPGACAIAFAIPMIGEIQSRDPYMQIVLGIWAICLAISALGAVLIVVARKGARREP
jgi:hypothetical protein